MVKSSFVFFCVAVRQVDATASTCAGVTWSAGGTRGAATANPSFCGQHGTQTSWGDLQPFPTGVTQEAQGCAAAACIATDDHQKCCYPACGFVTFTGGTGTDAAASGATKATIYCGADKVPITAQTTTALTVPSNTRAAPTTADIGTCCQDACGKSATTSSTVTYTAGAGTDALPIYYCGAGRIPIANQATTPSGAASNVGGQKTTCCNDSCGKVSFMAGAGTDDSGATTPKYYCGLGSVPVASQTSKDSGSDAVGASQKTTCCDNACGKVSFKAGAGTDVSTSGSEAYYCGENRVPVAKQGEIPSGSDAVGAGEKTTCCDDACGKVTFKAGAGTDDSASTTYYCGENKVPVAKQATVPSGSDAIGAGQKGTCCAGACSTVTYKMGEGTDADTTYFCGKDKAPKKDQKTLPCNGATCTSAGKSNCCAATCASTKWAMGKKPASPASGTMYCGDGMSPKAALADTVCASDGGCVEATDAGTCCEKTKVNNTSATTDAQTAGASVLLLSAALLMTIQ